MNFKDIPSWPDSGLLGMTPNAYAAELERAECSVRQAEMLAGTPPSGAPALRDALEAVDRTRDLLTSLLTLARARLSLDATDTSSSSWRSAVKCLSVRLEAAALTLKEAARALPEDVRKEEPFSSWFSSLTEVKPEADDISSEIITPLSSMHAHLVSTMKLRVADHDGRTLPMSFAQASAVLKTSDDSGLRRSVFSAYSAWFAEHSPAFADLLNAMLGWRLLEANRSGKDIYGAALAKERLSFPAFRAMQGAIERHLPDIRRTVIERAHTVGQPRLHVSQLLASSPCAGAPVPHPFRSPAGVTAALKLSMASAGGDFSAYLNELTAKRRIDARPRSGRAGGTWCDNLPAFDAVAVFSNFIPSTAGAFQFAHPCGVGFLHRTLHGLPALRKRVPLSVVEIVGLLAETMLERTAYRSLLGTPDEGMILWQIRRRAANQLLTLPARHQLMRELLNARRQHALSVPEINRLSREAWMHFFGDASDGFDQYVWASKPHFYRPHVFFYDWQYTFGYLVSQLLARTFEHDGATKAGADLRGFCLDAAYCDCETLLSRHLAADITSDAFWDDAVSEALSYAGRD